MDDRYQSSFLPSWMKLQKFVSKPSLSCEICNFLHRCEMTWFRSRYWKSFYFCEAERTIATMPISGVVFTIADIVITGATLIAFASFFLCNVLHLLSSAVFSNVPWFLTLVTANFLLYISLWFITRPSSRSSFWDYCLLLFLGSIRFAFFTEAELFTDVSFFMPEVFLLSLTLSFSGAIIGDLCIDPLEEAF